MKRFHSQDEENAIDKTVTLPVTNNKYYIN